MVISNETGSTQDMVGQLKQARSLIACHDFQYTESKGSICVSEEWPPVHISLDYYTKKTALEPTISAKGILRHAGTAEKAS